MGDDGESFSVEDAPEAEPAEGIAKAPQACGCCCVGFIMFPIVLYCLAMSEKNNVCNQRNIEAAKAAKTVACDKLPEDNTLIFFSCPLDESNYKTFNLLTFNPSMDREMANLLEFKSTVAEQTVEMYQCGETKHEEYQGQGKDRKKKIWYTHALEWSSQVRSGFVKTPKAGACPGYTSANPSFPDNVPNGDTVKRADSVKAGKFTLYDKLTLAYGPTGHVSLSDFTAKFPSTLPTVQPSSITATNVKPVKDGNRWYLKSCDQDKLGCVRIAFNKNFNTYAAVIANSGTGGIIKPQPTKASWGCKAGTYDAIYHEHFTKDEVLEKEEHSNSNSRWMMRAVGIIGAWLAVYCCCYPVVAFFDIISDYMNMVPCVGDCLGGIADLAESIVQCVVCCLSCSVGVSSALLVIAFMLLFMNPLYSILIFLAVGLVMVGAMALLKLSPKKSGASAPSPEEGS